MGWCICLLRQEIPNQIALSATQWIANVISRNPAEVGLLERARLLD